MNRDIIWGLAILAAMMLTVACDSDDDNVDPAVKNFVDSTTYTDEELTGFVPLGIQGEWEMSTYYEIGGGEPSSDHVITAMTATLFFNDKGKVRVVASRGNDFFLPTGVYDYTLDESNHTLVINGTLFIYHISQGNLYFVYPDSEKMYHHSFARKPSVLTAIPGFFEQFEDSEVYKMPSFEYDQWRTAFNVINSQEELEQLLVTDKAIPQIDFSRYTLISGNITIYQGMLVNGMELKEEDGQNTLHIYIENYNPHGYGIQVTKPYFYWRLYPKLDKDVRLQIEETTIEM